MSKLIKKIIIYFLDKLIYIFDMFEAKELPKNPDSDLEVDVEMGQLSSGDSKFDALLRILNLWWGILFRALLFPSWVYFHIYWQTLHQSGMCLSLN